MPGAVFTFCLRSGPWQGARHPLSGSADTVAEFFSFGINSILYLHGNSPEPFTWVQKYGLPLLVTTDPELTEPVYKVVERWKVWLYKCSAQKLGVVISNMESGEVLERWQSDTECDEAASNDRVPRDESQKALKVKSTGWPERPQPRWHPHRCWACPAHWPADLHRQRHTCACKVGRAQTTVCCQFWASPPSRVPLKDTPPSEQHGSLQSPCQWLKEPGKTMESHVCAFWDPVNCRSCFVSMINF